MGMMPRPRRLRVVGIFSLGLYEYDNAYGFVTLDVAKRLLNKDRVELMELRIDDLDAARETAARCRTPWTGVFDGGLVPDEPVALLSPVARENGDFDHDWPDRDSGRAEHRRFARPARHGERAGTSPY